jgi:hypothetical protein
MEKFIGLPPKSDSDREKYNATIITNNTSIFIDPAGYTFLNRLKQSNNFGNSGAAGFSGGLYSLLNLDKTNIDLYRNNKKITSLTNDIGIKSDVIHYKYLGQIMNVLHVISPNFNDTNIISGQQDNYLKQLEELYDNIFKLLRNYKTIYFPILSGGLFSGNKQKKINEIFETKISNYLSKNIFKKRIYSMIEEKLRKKIESKIT